MNAQPPRIAARNARNRQRDRALRAALTANTEREEQVVCEETARRLIPLTAQCLADGERSKDFGVWGGLNPDERRARRKALREVAS